MAPCLLDILKTQYNGVCVEVNDWMIENLLYNSHYHKDEVNEITPNTYTPNHIATETDNISDNTDVDGSDSTMDSASDYKWLSWEHKIIEVKLSDTKYAANFPVKINSNKTVSLFATCTTISCMSKAFLISWTSSSH